MICGTGMAGDGIRVAKKMTVLGGKIDAIGYLTGLTVLEITLSNDEPSGTGMAGDLRFVNGYVSQKR